MVYQRRRVLGAGAALAATLFAGVLGDVRGTDQIRTHIAYAAAPESNGMSGAQAARLLNRAGSSTGSTSNRPMTDVHFILNWLPNVEFAGLWVAQKYGWFQNAGIRMTFTGWTPAVHPEEDVPARGGNTFGFQSGAAVVIAKAQHIPIQALYTDTQRSVFGLTVVKKSIKKITDLRGKRIGYQPHELYVPSTMLAFAGLKKSDWIPVPVGNDSAPLTAGNVDAFLTFLTNEPIALRLHGVQNHSFVAANYGFHFYDDVLFTYTGLINRDPKLVSRVVAVVARGFQWAHSHPVTAARLTVAAYFPASKGVSATENSLQQRLELQAFDNFSRDRHRRFSGLMTRAYWQDSVNTLYRYHEINNKPSVTSLFTNRFNPNRL